MLVDAKGNITVKSDPVREALDYYKRLMAFLPSDVPSWDDASNNKWLISGQGALIMNPPSAWAVAKRDAPKVAEQLWTHGFAAGPKGRYAPFVPFFWGIWNFSKNQAAAKSLIVHLSQPASVEKMVERAAATTCRRSPTSPPSRCGPRRGRPRARSITIPIPYNHQILSIAGAPAPHKIGEQIAVQAHPDPDGGAPLQGRGDGKDARLGRQANSKASRATEAEGAGGSTPATEAAAGRCIAGASRSNRPRAADVPAEGSRPARQCRRGPSVVGARKLVLPDRIELSTSPLPRECSTTELRQRPEAAGLGGAGYAIAPEPVQPLPPAETGVPRQLAAGRRVCLRFRPRRQEETAWTGVRFRPIRTSPSRPTAMSTTSTRHGGIRRRTSSTRKAWATSTSSRA